MIKKPKVICIIPARSGSKSVKNKNIKKFKGKPLIFHTIKYALKSKKIKKVIVSTDSKKYAEISKKFGAEVPFIRPKRLSTDYVNDFKVVRHALKIAETIYREKYQYIILLRPTSPLRPNGLIEKGLKLISKNKIATSVRAMIKIINHPYRMWIKKNQFVEGAIKEVKEAYNIPRQKLPTAFFQTGDIEIIKRKTIINGSISGKRVLPIILKSYHDIDHLKDFNV